MRMWVLKRTAISFALWAMKSWCIKITQNPERHIERNTYIIKQQKSFPSKSKKKILVICPILFLSKPTDYVLDVGLPQPATKFWDVGFFAQKKGRKKKDFCNANQGESDKTSKALFSQGRFLDVGAPKISSIFVWWRKGLLLLLLLLPSPQLLINKCERNCILRFLGEDERPWKESQRPKFSTL